MNQLTKSLWESQHHRPFLESPLGDGCKHLNSGLPCLHQFQTEKSQAAEDGMDSCWRSIPQIARPAWAPRPAQLPGSILLLSVWLIAALHRLCISFLSNTPRNVKSYTIHICRILFGGHSRKQLSKHNTNPEVNCCLWITVIRTEPMTTVNELMTRSQITLEQKSSSHPLLTTEKNTV